MNKYDEYLLTIRYYYFSYKQQHKFSCLSKKL